MECMICKRSLSEEEVCEYQGHQVCEDCYIQAHEPTKSCGYGISAMGKPSLPGPGSGGR